MCYLKNMHQPNIDLEAQVSDEKALHHLSRTHNQQEGTRARLEEQGASCDCEEPVAAQPPCATPAQRAPPPFTDNGPTAPISISSIFERSQHLETLTPRIPRSCTQLTC